MLARRLGVSHTYVQNLVREFKADLVRAVRVQRGNAWAALWDLDGAREQTDRERMQGYLRWPRTHRLAEFKICSNTVKAVVKTQAAEARAAEAALSPAQRSAIYREHEQNWANGRIRPVFAVPPEYWVAQRRPLGGIAQPMPQRRFRPGLTRGGRWQPGRFPRFY
jgi:hypothetical protein